MGQFFQKLEQELLIHSCSCKKSQKKFKINKVFYAAHIFKKKKW